MRDVGKGRLLAIAADHVAHVDQMLAHLAVERSPHLGVVQVQLRQRDLRLCRQDVRLGARTLVCPRRLNSLPQPLHRIEPAALVLRQQLDEELLDG